jgi:hypothetical protein
MIVNKLALSAAFRAIARVLFLVFGFVSLPIIAMRTIATLALPNHLRALELVPLLLIASIFDLWMIVTLLKTREMRFSWGLGGAALFRTALSVLIWIVVDSPVLLPAAAHFGARLGGGP